MGEVLPSSHPVTPLRICLRISGEGCAERERKRETERQREREDEQIMERQRRRRGERVSGWREIVEGEEQGAVR
jgi:hypothetical protein